MEQIIPRYSIVEAIDSDRGTHFAGKILQGVWASLGAQWNLHRPWHAQSSARVENNEERNKHLLKLVIETKMPWVVLWTLALVRMRAQPRREIQLSPIQSSFAITLVSLSLVRGGEASDVYLKPSVARILLLVKPLQQEAQLAQAPPLDFAACNIQPGD